MVPKVRLARPRKGDPSAVPHLPNHPWRPVRCRFPEPPTPPTSPLSSTPSAKRGLGLPVLEDKALACTSSSRSCSAMFRPVDGLFSSLPPSPPSDPPPSVYTIDRSPKRAAASSLLFAFWVPNRILGSSWEALKVAAKKEKKKKSRVAAESSSIKSALFIQPGTKKTKNNKESLHKTQKTSNEGVAGRKTADTFSRDTGRTSTALRGGENHAQGSGDGA